MERTNGRSADAIQGVLLDFISRAFFVERNDIDVDKSLVQTGIIDSIGLIEISSFMERTFGFHVTEGDMTRDNFGSVTLMSKFAYRRLSDGQQEAEDGKPRPSAETRGAASH